ncbi:hypothetical protein CHINAEXTREME_17975 [Halobiforma lacisalsi AJ5]|uniref:Uncharacterized protein n=1 Tax=Natronobacterium lacisalsi AJ5 TaxID=358396 RepID=M0LDL4_NATLA|nr:hypothetical protein [Halobiforma lacisalsi]APW99541.1 hypothetical protein CHINAEXTREME_17975 [Halobiforma lacisalsi AJ5]EMA31667.1 hypothetical protein C445_14332 [Halobiforma lacisalsi AJ5]
MAGWQIAARIGAYSAGATLGSLLVAYGIREVLFATGQSWYRYAAVQGSGALITFVGWVILLLTFVNLYGDLAESGVERPKRSSR